MKLTLDVDSATMQLGLVVIGLLLGTIIVLVMHGRHPVVRRAKKTEDMK